MSIHFRLSLLNDLCFEEEIINLINVIMCSINFNYFYRCHIIFLSCDFKKININAFSDFHLNIIYGNCTHEHVLYANKLLIFFKYKMCLNDVKMCEKWVIRSLILKELCGVRLKILCFILMLFIYTWRFDACYIHMNLNLFLL